MRKSRRKITKKTIVKTAMKLINNKKNSSTVTIRKIANKLNCSHPNIYNYYSGINELLWDTLRAVMQKMVKDVMVEVKKNPNREQDLQVFFSALINFYLNNQGWYSLIWFDELEGEPPEDVKKTIIMPRQTFSAFLQELYPKYDLTDLGLEITDLIHSYVHGQISKYIKGRSFFKDKSVLKKTIIKTSNEVIDFYIKEKGEYNEQ